MKDVLDLLAAGATREEILTNYPYPARYAWQAGNSGTRTPVELIVRKLSDGASEADLLDAYPRLLRDDIRAALRYAADALACEETAFIDTEEA